MLLRQVLTSVLDGVLPATDKDTDTRAVAVEQLHHRYAAQIYEKCLRMLECPAEAEDAVQETFLRAYRALPELRDRRAAVGWLYRIATNVSLNMIRSRRRAGTTPVGDCDDLGSPPPNSGPRALTGAPGYSCRNSVDNLHYRRTLERLAGKLDQRSLEIVVAHYLDGLSQGEVAAHLGLSRRSVVKRLTKVRQHVVAMLGPGETHD